MEESRRHFIKTMAAAWAAAVAGQALIELMATLNREQGVTFIFATHDPKVMEAATRVVTLVDGEISEDLRK